MLRAQYLAVIGLLKIEIEQAERAMRSPPLIDVVPKPIRWLARATGTSMHLDAYLRRRLQLRLDELIEDRRTLIDDLFFEDVIARRYPNSR